MHKDLVGKTFELLTVLSRDGYFRNGAIRWCCRCECGNIIYVSSKDLIHNRVKSCGCLLNKSRFKKGEDHKNYKGKKKDKKGRILIYAPCHPRSRHNYVYEHVLIMEQHLGRRLLKDEKVFHKNGILEDNRIENLEIGIKTDLSQYTTVEAMVEFCKRFLEDHPL